MSDQKIIAYTLVDVTNSGSVLNQHANTIAYHQMQNLNVLSQIIGLRTQPYIHDVVALEDQKISGFKFAKRYKGKHRIWKLIFSVERYRPFDDGIDELGLLINDANGVAITSCLTETVDFPVDVFDTLKHVNLYFEKETD